MKTPVMPTVLSSRPRDEKFSVSFFNTDPRVLSDDELIEYREAGATAVSLQLFMSPTVQYPTIDVYTKCWDAMVRPSLERAQKFGLAAVGRWDDLLRTPPERDRTSACPWLADAVEYVAVEASKLGLIRAETVDEINNIPSEYPMKLVVDPWRAACKVPVVHPNVHPQVWEIPAMADACSRYFSVWDPKDVRYQSNGIQYAYENARKDWKLYMALSCVGPMYTKGGVGGDYVKGWPQDSAGIRGREFIGQLYDALGVASGVNTYAYDWDIWRDGRANAAIGTRRLQTGSRLGDTRWPAVRMALSSVSSRQRELMGPSYEPVFGDRWACYRRGNLWWARNRSLVPRDASKLGVVVTALGETYSKTVPSGCVILYPV